MKTKTRNPILRRLSQERGWTLIELLVGLALMIAVIFAAFPIIDGAARTESRIQTAALSVGDARAFSDSVLRDLRPATGVVGAPNSTSLTVKTYVRHSCGTTTLSAQSAPATECQVTYSCSGDTCTRRESNLNGSGPGPTVTIIKGLEKPQVFSYVLAGDYISFVGITIEIPNQDDTDDAITLQDGTALRNVGT